MTEKTITNVQTEATSINEILRTARNRRAYEGVPQHLQLWCRTLQLQAKNAQLGCRRYQGRKKAA
jgi:hypothetical protein